MTVVESPKGRASHNLGNRGAIPPFPPPGYCYIFFQNLSRKESSSPPAPSRFRLILRLEKTDSLTFADLVLCRRNWRAACRSAIATRWLTERPTGLGSAVPISARGWPTCSWWLRGQLESAPKRGL